MRSFFFALGLFVVATIAAPQPEAVALEIANGNAVEIEERAPDDGPILDDLIEHEEAQKRTVNLSPMNNVKNGGSHRFSNHFPNCQ